MMVNRIRVCIGVGGGVRRQETSERGKKRQRILNGGGGVRPQQEETCVRGKKRQRILNGDSGVRPQEEETCERGKKRQRNLNGGGGIRPQEEETCEREKKGQRILNGGGGVRPQEKETCERGNKRQRILNGGGGIRPQEEETRERGKKRQRILNGGGGVRPQEEETCEGGKKRQKILNELIDHSSFKILPVDVKIPSDLRILKDKLDGNIYFGAKEFADDVRRRFQKIEKSCDHQSPEKALRAAMLKTRYADTIFKAKKTLQLTNKVEEEALKQSNEVEEEALKQFNELKRRRERQRQRKALEDMEKAAAANSLDNTATELKTLFGATGYPTSEALKRLGLYIKDEEKEEEEELQRRRQRHRKALEDMEKAAADNVDNTTTVLKNLFGATGYPTSEPLNRLGLYIKV